MTKNPRIGPFRLHQILGQGGMGTVWAGQHEAQGLPVAVKILSERFSDHSWFLSSFATEVRAVARLSHPNIVRVLDHGVVGEDARHLQGRGVGSRSPWLAMEQVPGAPLSRLRGQLDWPALARVFAQLLAALAHAHARGVLHRDIKPGNVIVGDERVVLLDFGIARVGDSPGAGPEGDEDEEVVGTTAYMAPEQFSGRAAELGPWTDLYALGCTAWAAITGDAPFGRNRLLAHIRDDHLHRPLPPLDAPVALPPGLADWLGRLLEKDPARRYQRAADAAYALASLGLPAPPLSDAPTLLGPRATEDSDPPPAPRPPLPATWREAESGAPTMKLVGAGLRLFGLRAIPLVGREEQRDALWQALVAAERGQPAARLLQGAAGSGKSALAAWLCERAHALGAADVLQATWSEGGSAGDGLGPALARWLRCSGSSREHRLHQGNAAALRWGLNAGDSRDLLALLGVGDTGRFSGATERDAALARILGQASKERPLILRLEDVHWGSEALAFALQAQRRWADQPVSILLLLTARECRPASLEGQLVQRLLQWPGTQRLEVGPLAPGWRSRLIEELLHLNGDLARRVEGRTAGNPLFITQLVGDWVARGVLVAGAQGFELRPGIQPDLPDDLHAVWQARVKQALVGRDPLEARALELAAILGMTVDRGEWRRACRHAGAWPSPELVETLLAAGLIEAGPDGADQGFSLVHGMLRESLERAADASGWGPRARLGCVAMLQESAEASGADALRLGRHLLALGRPDDAILPLTQGAWACVADSEYLRAAEALRLREQALSALDPAPDDRRPAEGWLMAARVARRRGELAEAAAFSARCEAAARREGFDDLLCQSLRERARMADFRGDRAAAIAALAEAVAVAETGSDPLALAWCRRDLALHQVDAGLRDRDVDGPLASAQAVFQVRGEVFGEATCLLARGRASQRAGRGDRALRLLQAAAKAFHRAAELQEPAHAWVGLAEVAALLGEVHEAERWSRAAIGRFREIGNPGTPAAVHPLASALVEGGRPEEAAALLQAHLAELQEADRPGWIPPAAALLAWARIAAGQPAPAREALALLRNQLQATGGADALAASAALRCAAQAAERGDATLEAEALALARDSAGD